MIKLSTMTPKNPAAVALGRRGGKARVQNQTAEQRSESARRAAEARWAKTEKLVAGITSGTKELLKKTQAAARARTKKAKQKKAATDGP
jgi:hypothetical protein